MFYELLVAPLTFALTREDPEAAHHAALRALKRVQASPRLLSTVEWLYNSRYNPVHTTVCNIAFPNRVGLAAGFDKNAEALRALQALGFGFIEFGTVLPMPQPGNPRPRMFRFPEQQALINRMGFNSDGAEIVRENLEKYRGSVYIPLIGSLGKMKETPNDDAAKDYVKAARKIRRYARILSINVSSPNTPGLRALQGKAYLEHLVRTVVEAEKTEAAKASDTPRPIFVKISPDLTERETEETVEAIIVGGGAGIIACNTSIDARMKAPLGSNEQGGVSGKPLFLRALFKVRDVRKLVPTDFPIIGVGGIMSRDDANKMFDVGATLIQLYTGLVYHGPKLIQHCR